ncbi:MAG: response regulator transcription factor [Nannocystaceae bacterium]|nr:response regulator transcription factor [Nannocystaceae bacterium]
MSETTHDADDPQDRILVVEDDDNLRLPLTDVLEEEGFVVDAAATGEEGLTLAAKRPPDVVILDIMLPGIDGYAVCKQLRATGCSAGILMLTARTLEDDVVRGFDAGADDYLAKPYRLRELLARVGSLLRRHAGTTASDPTLKLGRWTVNREARTVSDASGHEVEMTRTEFDLLVFLADRPGKALPRTHILERVWGQDIAVDPRTVDNFVSSLKRKLAWTKGCGFSIRAVRGVGYRFERD